MKKICIVFTLLFLVLGAYAQPPIVIKVGDNAPKFSGVDNNGKNISLKSLLKDHNTVVVFFYRGQWCPYCNKHIKQLQDSLQLLTAKGAFVIGITPETDLAINTTIYKTHATFPIIHDKDYKIMKAFGVNYIVDAITLEKLRKNHIDIDFNNGNADHVLPVPATFVVNKAGKITFVHFNPDYTKRPSVSDILAVL